MHDIGYVFAAIEIKMFTEWKFQGSNGGDEKTFVAMGMKTIDIYVFILAKSVDITLQL